MAPDWLKAGAGERRALTSHPSLKYPCCSGLWEGGEVPEEENNPERPLRARACPSPKLGSPSTNQTSSAPHPALTGHQVTTDSRGHVVGARPLVVAMAASGSSVVSRVEELGDLAQAHIQQLSEAAGEDGEGAGEREAGGRTVAQSWCSAAVGT